MVAALTRSINRLAPVDRASLLGDTWALAEAGRTAPAAFFGLVEQLTGDDNRVVVDQIIRPLTRIDHLQWGRPDRAPFQAYGRAILRPVIDRIGWDTPPLEAADPAPLRTRPIIVPRLEKRRGRR